MLDLLEGYLDNIDVAAATQAVTKRGPLEELSASLLISIDKVVLKKKKLSVCMNKLKPRKRKGLRTPELSLREEVV